jgi:hypothetical protein
MKNNVLNYTELQQRIAQLKLQKADKEELIKYNAKEIYSSFDPVNIIKKTLSRIADDSEIKTGVLSIILNKTIGFISDKIYSSNKHTHHSSSSSKSNKFFSSIGNILTGLLAGK